MSKRHFQSDRRNGGYSNGGYSNGYNEGPSHKKHKDNNHHRQHAHNTQYNNDLRKIQQEQQKSSILAPSPLPPLPPITSDAPFRHSSTVGLKDSYERLEFVGDGWLGAWAVDVIDARFPNILAGRMSQVKELLVKNETLAVYSRAYGFDKKLQVADLEGMKAADKANKGYNKVLGDVFEAYVAAVGKQNSKKAAQEWVEKLWEPALQQLQDNDPTMVGLAGSEGVSEDQHKIFDPEAKQKLQKRIGFKNVKLDYKVDKPSIELKGDQLGQNRHFIALYLTGYGYTEQFLGKGEGRSKTEAGQWAAIEAMYGGAKGIVDQCEAKANEMREQLKLEKEERAKEAGAAAKDKSDVKEESGVKQDLKAKGEPDAKQDLKVKQKSKIKEEPKDLLDTLEHHLQPT